MKILVACEESQTVTTALRAIGHDAFSCDIMPCSGSHPEWHIKADAIDTMWGIVWDAVVAFPPCTHLAVSGAKHFKEKIASGVQQEAIRFFLRFVNWGDITGRPLAIENPVGIMSTMYRKPDQIIQPWQFGHHQKKRTCLWLRGLPLLAPTRIVGPPKRYKDMTKQELDTWTRVHRMAPGPERAKERSKTFTGIAIAMASQWFKQANDEHEVS